ncbi:endothelin-converting enzyme 1 [Malassezia caprae]|uniref:Endothelin-converting enzyme 1 n=1 Tax=Malassezia caprae TaxID=1381934 RepID=A0AAF0E5H5_9BASI|nr:endothelin-converting enzyme 1 [Malassezia caprae]
MAHESDRLLPNAESGVPRRAFKSRACEFAAVLFLLLLLAAGVVRITLRDDRRALRELCTSRACVLTATELIQAMNETADPCDDFYEFSTGGWRAAHPIPADAGLFGVGQWVAAQNDEVVRRILARPVDDRTLSRMDQMNLAMLKTHYDACMDTRTLDLAGGQHLLDSLKELYGALQGAHNLTDALVWLHLRDMPALFAMDITGDPGYAPTTATPTLVPGELGVPDASYLDDADARELYRTQLVRAVHELRQVHADARESVADAVLEWEHGLARLQPDAVSLADPNATYNPMSVRELQTLAPAIDWARYLHAMSPHVQPHKVIVASPTYLAALSEHVASADPLTVRAYLYWTVVRTMGLYLGPSVPLAQPARALRNYAAGVPADAPEDRAATCLAALNGALGYMTGRFFVQAAMPPGTKEAVEELVEHIRQAFYDRLAQLAWLDDATRARARAKAAAITVKVGYPTHPDTTSADAVHAWYAALPVVPSYYQNEIDGRLFRVKRAWSYLGGELNPELLGDLMTTEVNAEYSADHNEMAFPAGLLQRPYFDASWPQYLQYGALGTTAGHELSHAFDPSGRQFDAHGLLRDWWTPATSAQFEARQQCIAAQYGNYTWPDGRGGAAHVQSALTLGEDVADAGGLAQSYEAWQKLVRNGSMDTLRRNRLLPGLQHYTQEQLFFLAYGVAWARNIRTGEALKRLHTDPHSPTKYRVNGALANFPPFAKAFGCRAGHDAMARAPAERCEIW